MWTVVRKRFRLTLLRCTLSCLATAVHIPEQDFNDIYIISEIVDSMRLLQFMQTRLEMRAGVSEGWLAQASGIVLCTGSPIFPEPHSSLAGVQADSGDPSILPPGEEE